MDFEWDKVKSSKVDGPGWNSIKGSGWLNVRKTQKSGGTKNIVKSGPEKQVRADQMKGLRFYLEEPSFIKRASFFALGYSVWIVPALIGLSFNDLWYVIGAYALLGGSMLHKVTRSYVMRIHQMMQKPWVNFETARKVSGNLRATLKNSGLVVVEKTEKENVTTYPHVDIFIDQYNYYLTFHMLPGQTTDNWENKASAFAHALGCDLVKYEIKRGLVTAVLQHTQMRTDVVTYKWDSDHYLNLGYGAGGVIKWEFDEMPHLLIIGETGNGKSTYLRNLFIQFQHDWDLKIIDGKVVEFSFLRKFGFDVAEEKDYVRYIQETQEEVSRRYELLDKEGVNNYQKLGMKPLFLVVDEFIYVIESIRDKKVRDDLTRRLTDIALRGRAAGVFLMLILQRPDSKYLDTVIRDNIKAKVVLGDATETAYEMAFGAENKKMTPLDKGEGYVQIGSKMLNFTFPDYGQEKFVEDVRFRSRRSAPEKLPTGGVAEAE